MAEDKQLYTTRYLNVLIRPGEVTPGRYASVPARTTLTRSLPFVTEPGQWAVSVFRVGLSLEFPIMIVPLQVGPSSDGISTVWSITLQYIDAAGIQYVSQKYIQLQLPPGATPRAGILEQPKDFYAGVYSQSMWLRMKNDAVQRAYAEINTNSGGSLSADTGGVVPFYTLRDDARIELTGYPYSLYDQAMRAPGLPGVNVWYNLGSEPVINGWPLVLKRKPANAPSVSPDGRDWLLKLNRNGGSTTYLPKRDPSTQVPGPAPTTPSTSWITLTQEWVCKTYPGLDRIEVLTSLPVVQEGIPSSGGNASLAVLTDFRPDVSDAARGSAQQSLIYNASLGNARWADLVGKVPIQSFDISLDTIDWQGTRRPLSLLFREDSVNVKFAFVKKAALYNDTFGEPRPAGGRAVEWY